MKQKKEPVDLLLIENTLREKGFSRICGVDEAGRGPLAGPVAAGAVILPAGLQIEGLNDSKKLTEKKREALYETITREALCWSVGLATEREIDEMNILQATYLAMHRAVEGLKVSPDYILVDGNRDPGFSVPTETLVGGDGKAAAIAAASILAKVTRDRMMIEADKAYPAYGFAVHKGYGTKAHYLALLSEGLCPLHRRTFLTNLEEKREKFNVENG